MQAKRIKVAAIAAAVGLALVTTGATASQANAATKTSLKGVSVIVGSKDFTESIVLSKIVKQFILANGGKLQIRQISRVLPQLAKQ